MAQFDPQFSISTQGTRPPAQIKESAPEKQSLPSATTSIEQTARSPSSSSPLPHSMPVSTTEESVVTIHTTANEALRIRLPAASVVLHKNATLEDIERYLENWAQEAPDENRAATKTQIMDFLEGKIDVLNFEDAFSLPDIFHLDVFNKVEDLYIHSPHITALPQSIGHLTQLNSLDIKAPNLRLLPESIGQLTNLTTLTINAPNLTGLPESMRQLSDLVSLVLNTSVAVLPEYMRSFTNLMMLSIQSPTMTAFPEVIKEMTQLTHLSLDAPLIEVPGSALSPLIRLQSFKLSGCKELQALPAEIGNLPKLQQLHLSGLPKLTHLSEEVLNPRLQTLNFTDCANLVALPEILETLPNLQTLSLDACPQVKLSSNLYTIHEHVLTIKVPLGTTKTCARQHLALLAQALRSHPKDPPLTIEVLYLGGADSPPEQALKTFLMDITSEAGKAYDKIQEHSMTAEDAALCRDLGTLLATMASNDKGYKCGHALPQSFYAGLTFLLQLKSDGTVLPPEALTRNLCLILARADQDGPTSYGERLFDLPETLLKDYELTTSFTQKLGKWASSLVEPEDEPAKAVALFKVWRLFNTLQSKAQIEKMFPSMKKYIGSPLVTLPLREMARFAETFQKTLNSENRRLIEQAIIKQAYDIYHTQCAPLIEVSQSFNPAATLNKLLKAQLLSKSSMGKDLQTFFQTDSKVEALDANGKTALIRAAEQGDVQTVHTLLAAGANFHAQDKNGYTPLMLAACSGQVDIVAMLIAAGSNVNMCDKNGHTALMQAASNGQPEIAGLLIAAGSDVNAHSKKGYTALSFGELYYPDSELTELLQNNAADREYAVGSLEDIFMAHVWGLQGHSTRHDQPFHLEGLQAKYALNQLSTYVEQFFDSEEIDPELLTDQDKNDIREAIALAFPASKDYEEALSRIESNKPMVMVGGTTNHAVAMVIFENRLLICNRGAGRGEMAVNAYDLSSITVTEEMLKVLTTSYKDMREFNVTINKMLADLKLPHLEQESFNQKSQKTGNCAWVGPKGIVGAIFRRCAQKNHRSVKEGEDLHKRFTAWCRKQAMQHYVQPEPARSYRPNPDILQKLQEKLDHKRPVFAPQSRELLKQALRDREAA